MKNIVSIQSMFKKYPAVKLVYLFGSFAKGKNGPLSDYDFAIFLDEKNASKRFDLRLSLISDLSRIMQTESDKIDLVILNDVGMPELKYHVIKDGDLIYEQEPYKVIVEPLILNEYFDFHYSLKQFGLTRS